MKPDMIIFTIDLQYKPSFRWIMDKGAGWKALVICCGIIVIEFNFSEVV